MKQEKNTLQGAFIFAIIIMLLTLKARCCIRNDFPRICQEKVSRRENQILNGICLTVRETHYAIFAYGDHATPFTS
jgi:hypothetical protein